MSKIITPLEKAEKDLKDFLEENPQLKSFQAEIDSHLSKIEGSRERMMMLNEMLLNNITLINQQFKEIEEIAEDFVSSKSKPKYFN